MLNNTMPLVKTLNQQRVKQYRWHNSFNPLPSSNNFRVWIKNDGSIEKIELMSNQLASSCRKYVTTKGSLPAFNISPLFKVSSEDKLYCKNVEREKEQLDLDRLRQMCVQDFWDEKLFKKIERCLQCQFPKMPEDSAIFALLEIIKKIDVQNLRNDLEKYVWANLQNNPQTMLPLLVTDGSQMNKSVSIFLDLADWEKFGDPIASEVTTRQINEWLLALVEDHLQSCSNQLDAFGDAYNPVGEPMPLVRLCKGFDVKLRTMFSGQLCQFRYGKSDDDSFPISKKNRDAAKAALEWISKPSNKGKTWTKIGAGEVVFAYPDKLPQSQDLLDLAQMLGNDPFELSEKSFVEVAAQVVKAFKGIPPDEMPKEIEMFALQQILPSSSNRAKVVYTRNLQVETLFDSANAWKAGCENLPKFKFLKPKAPFPLHVYQTANQIWKQDGTRADGKTKVKILKYYQGLQLLLGEMHPWQLKSLVRSLTTNWQALVQYFGNNDLRRKNGKPIIKQALVAEMSDFVTLLALILYKFNKKKEEFMQDTAYLLGQMLKVSDLLHVLYCEAKRDGEVPPQLVGNSVFNMASETPTKALEVISKRMSPYLAWASQSAYNKKSLGEEKEELANSTDDKKSKGGLARWIYGLYGKLATQLASKLTENQRFSEFEKAQLFLGYLAELPSTKNKESVNEEESK